MKEALKHDYHKYKLIYILKKNTNLKKWYEISLKIWIIERYWGINYKYMLMKHLLTIFILIIKILWSNYFNSTEHKNLKLHVQTDLFACKLITNYIITFFYILFEQFFLTVKWHMGANDYWNIYFFLTLTRLIH